MQILFTSTESNQSWEHSVNISLPGIAGEKKTLEKLDCTTEKTRIYIHGGVRDKSYNNVKNTFEKIYSRSKLLDSSLCWLFLTHCLDLCDLHTSWVQPKGKFIVSLYWHRWLIYASWLKNVPPLHGRESRGRFSECCATQEWWQDCLFPNQSCLSNRRRQ